MWESQPANRSYRSEVLIKLRYLLCLLVLGGVWACSPAGAGEGPGDDENLLVSRGTLAPRLLLSGELEAVESFDILVPRTSEWRIQIRWMAPDGSAVVAGERVIEFDNASFTNNLEEKRLTALRARRTLDQQKAEIEVRAIAAAQQLETARIALAKAEIDSSVPESLLSRRDYQDVKLALEKARVEQEKAREELEVTETEGQAELAVKQIELEKTLREIEAAEEAIAAVAIDAPQDGIVIVGEHPWEGRKFEEGDVVFVGFTIMRMPDLSRMQVKARLSDVDDELIEVGMRVRCVLDTYPDLLFDGTITEITVIAQESARSSLRRHFRATVSLDESDPERMRPGMSVKVEVPQERFEDVLLAPRAALDLGSETPQARLRDGSWAAITIGPCSAHACVITDGLRVGTLLAKARIPG